LDSVLSQTHTELQVVAINDGSTDKSATILNEYASRDSRLQVVHRENRGVATTRLELLSLAKGEYVNFVDSDDTIQPDMIESMVAVCEENNLDMIVCRCITDMTITASTDNTRPIEIVNHDRAIREFLEHKRLVGSLCSKVTRRVAYRNINCPPEISYGEDAYMCWQALNCINRLGFVDAPFYHYRMNEASISHKPLGKSKMSSRILWNYIVNEVSTKYPQYLTLAQAQRGRNSLMLLFDAARGGCMNPNDVWTLKSDIHRDYTAMQVSGLVERNKFMFYQLSCLSWPLAKLVIKAIYH
jgi:glycosyltransferase involved in cell wall biosynthesis